jgi:hypothetical protein
MAFESNVFINCPFDNKYTPLLRTLVFTTLYLDLTPHLSQTISSSNIRINQIKQHIKSCKYGIHDLSRSKAMIKNELPRFNMPYELGLDIGAMEYGVARLKTKKILILETERYHYQKVISDIAGQDIYSHDDNPQTLVKRVRDWFSINSDNKVAPTSEIWTAYNQFIDDLSNSLAANFTPEEIQEMPIGDYIKFAKDWIVEFKN